MNYIYSKETNSFYPKELEEEYKNAGNWPDSYVDVSEEEHAKFIAALATGKSIIPSSNGYPTLTTVTIYSPEDFVRFARLERDGLANKATQTISAIQLKQMNGKELSSSEKEKLNKVLNYLEALDNVELSKAPEISWPQFPEQD